MRTVPLCFRIALATAGLVLSTTYMLCAAAGDLYTMDETGGPIVRISPDGTKTTFASGVGSTSSGMAFDRSGNLYVAAGSNVLKFNPNGNQSTFATGLSTPAALAVDANGNLFVADRGNHSIFKFSPDGTKSVFAVLPNGASSMTFDAGGNLLVADANNNSPVLKFRPDGTSTVFAANSTGMFGVAVDGVGNVFTSEFVPGNIYKFSPDGATRTLFSPAAGASTGVLNFDRAGTLFVNVQGQQSIYKITPGGAKSLFASGLGFAAWSAFELARGYSLNLSTRLRVQTGDNIMVIGFIGTDPTTVVIRGIGPSLSQAGIRDALSDPILELHDSSGAIIQANDNWRETQEAQLQASGLAPTNDTEAAMLVTLSPGAYTAIIRGKNDVIGVGVVEVYDLNRASRSKLMNLSTRGRVETGENVMIAGFIIGDNGETVLLRALGPSLVTSGVLQPLLDPTLVLCDGNGSFITSNDNWKETQETAIRGTGMAPPNDLESAILTTLPPGQYTAIVQGHIGQSGVAVVEIYNVN